MVRVSHPCLMFNRLRGTRHNPIKVTVLGKEYYVSKVAQLTGPSGVEYADDGLVKLWLGGDLWLDNATEQAPVLKTEDGDIIPMFPGG